MAHILIIDDKSDITSLIADILSDEGHSSDQIHNVQGACQVLGEMTYDAVILDIWLEDNKMDGLGLLRIIKKKYKNMPVIMISGHATAEVAAQAIKMGAYDFIEKPFKSDKITFIIKRALEMKSLSDLFHSTDLNNIRSKIVGSHHDIVQARERCIQLAKNNSRILICGQGGVGKKLCAQTIHTLSNRKSSRMITYRAEGKSEEQISRDLRGDRGHLSIFEMAQHGALIIENIDLLPLAIQKDIVVIIQEGSLEVRRQTIELDVRIIATSCCSVEDLKESLDPSLFSRISTNIIKLPPLQGRAHDIIELIDHFSSLYCEEMLLRSCNIAQETVSMMLGYNWPGNVEELQNVVHRLCLIQKHHRVKVVTASDLPREIISHHKECHSETENMKLFMQKKYRDAKQEFDRLYLQAQMEKFSGNISRTSEFIGLDRTALHKKIKILGLKYEDSNSL